jgi:hypothetical protein
VPQRLSVRRSMRPLTLARGDPLRDRLERYSRLDVVWTDPSGLGSPEQRHGRDDPDGRLVTGAGESRLPLSRSSTSCSDCKAARTGARGTPRGCRPASSESFRFTPFRRTASGKPRPWRITWRLPPRAARSTGFGPIRSLPCTRADATGVHDRLRPINRRVERMLAEPWSLQRLSFNR